VPWKGPQVPKDGGPFSAIGHEKGWLWVGVRVELGDAQTSAGGQAGLGSECSCQHPTLGVSSYT
jgi:hypothetical protein